MGFGEENRALSGAVHAVVRYPILQASDPHERATHLKTHQKFIL
jgi:hypothetical protein